MRDDMPRADARAAAVPSAAAQAQASRTRRQAEVVAALSEALPPAAILFRHEDTVPYECDALTAYRASPLVVVIPETETQVVAILRICHRLGVPVIARGAGTGLSGGVTPHLEGVVLSLAKFNTILAIDAAACTAAVQCGVRNLAISDAAAPYGLYYAPDPSSQIACTIGGNVAENSGGVHCLKYGMTLHNVLRVRGYLIDGEPVEFGSRALDAAGLDLLPVIVGSEGMLAVTTEVTVKLIPKPQLARCIMASFDDIESAGAAVASVIAQGIIPAGLELMDKAMTAAVEAFVQADYDLDAAAILLCESDGTPSWRWRRKLRGWNKFSAPRGPLEWRSAAMRRSARSFGAAARMPFRRPAGSARTTCAWIPPYPANAWRRCCAPSSKCRASTACAASMCSMPATAICIR